MVFRQDGVLSASRVTPRAVLGMPGTAQIRKKTPGRRNVARELWFRCYRIRAVRSEARVGTRVLSAGVRRVS